MYEHFYSNWRAEMSKGKRPRENDRPRVETRMKGEGGGGIVTDEAMSWTFSLQDKTPFASLISVGTSVRGKVQDKDVLVRNGSNGLGYAPANVAREIITAMTPKKRLEGAIFSVARNASGSSSVDVKVQLFLR
jgi:hypothetical protein